MEKKVGTAMTSCVRIILTGPESTGKTNLAAQLAERYNTVFIPEYAREYIQNLGRPYDYSDIEHIAKYQADQMKEFSSRELKILFVDTYLVITKIWFEWIYKRYPQWLNDELLKTKNDLYLLCEPDLPWYPDPVRENGGEARKVLFNLYKNELEKNALHYRCVSGKGVERVRHAFEQIDDFLYERGIKNEGNA